MNRKRFLGAAALVALLPGRAFAATSNDLLAQAWADLMLTTKSGVWYVRRGLPDRTPGWGEAKLLISQAVAAASSQVGKYIQEAWALDLTTTTSGSEFHAGGEVTPGPWLTVKREFDFIGKGGIWSVWV